MIWYCLYETIHLSDDIIWNGMVCTICNEYVWNEYIWNDSPFWWYDMSWYVWFAMNVLVMNLCETIHLSDDMIWHGMVCIIYNKCVWNECVWNDSPSDDMI